MEFNLEYLDNFKKKIIQSSRTSHFLKTVPHIYYNTHVYYQGTSTVSLPLGQVMY